MIKFVYFTVNAENYLKICAITALSPHPNRPADASYNPDDCFLAMTVMTLLDRASASLDSVLAGSLESKRTRRSRE